MPLFRVTVHRAVVHEDSYDIIARSSQAAMDAIGEALDDADEQLVHTEAISNHTEVIGAEEI